MIVPWTELPADLVRKVNDYFPKQSKLAQVCKKFFSLLRTGICIKRKLNGRVPFHLFNLRSVDINERLFTLRELPTCSITTLIYHSQNLIYFHRLLVSAALKELNELKLYGEWKHRDELVLQDISAHCPNLTRLTLEPVVSLKLKIPVITQLYSLTLGKATVEQGVEVSLMTHLKEIHLDLLFDEMIMTYPCASLNTFQKTTLNVTPKDPKNWLRKVLLLEPIQLGALKHVNVTNPYKTQFQKTPLLNFALHTLIDPQNRLPKENILWLIQNLVDLNFPCICDAPLPSRNQSYIALLNPFHYFFIQGNNSLFIKSLEKNPEHFFKNRTLTINNFKQNKSRTAELLDLLLKSPNMKPYLFYILEIALFCTERKYFDSLLKNSFIQEFIPRFADSIDETFVENLNFNKFDNFEQLMKQGFTPHQINYQGFTLYELSIQFKHESLVRNLHRIYPKKNTLSDYKIAIGAESNSILKFLLETSGFPKEKDMNKNNIYHLGLKSNNLAFTLLDFDGEYDLLLECNEDGITPHQLALLKNYYHLFGIMTKKLNKKGFIFHPSKKQKISSCSNPA